MRTSDFHSGVVTRFFLQLNVELRMLGGVRRRREEGFSVLFTVVRTAPAKGPFT